MRLALRDSAHAAVLALADAAAVPLAMGSSFVAAGMATQALGGPAFVDWGKGLGDRLPLMLPVMAAVAAWLHGRGRYAGRQPFWTENKDVLLACCLGFLVEGFTVYAVKEYVSRLWILGTWATLPLWGGMLRAWMKSCLSVLGVRLLPVLVVGDGREAVADALRSEPSIGWSVLPAAPDLDPVAVLDAATRESARHVVVVGHPAGAVVDVMRALSAAGLPHSLCLPVAGSGLASMRPDAIVGQDFVLMGERRGLSAPLARLAKRATDVSLALVIGAFALPVAAVTALVVSLDGGPVLYGQERVGRAGRRFRCLKFRTMVQDSDARLADLLARDPQAREEWERDRKLRRDPRVTRHGRLLRATALDELPQLLNVLRGDMSFVGPRPVTESELPRYGQDLAAYLGVRPGLTGLWQASGRNNVSYERRVALDAWYVRNWSAWLDLVVMLKTVPALLTRRGAY